MDNLSQVKILKKHLYDIGPITPAEAYIMYGIMRLVARIYDLKRAGARIKSETVQTFSGKRIAKYSIIS